MESKQPTWNSIAVSKPTYFQDIPALDPPPRAQRLAKEVATPTVAKLARVARLQDGGRFVEDWLMRWSLGRQANRLVKVIPSPNAAAELGRLRQISAKTARWAVGVTRILEEIGLFGSLRTEFRR